MIFYSISIQKLKNKPREIEYIKRKHENSLPFFIVAILFSVSVVLALLLLCLVSTFTSSSPLTSYHCLSSTYCSFNTFSSSTPNRSKILQHISPLRSLLLERSNLTPLHYHILYSKVPSPSMQRFSGDFRRSFCLFSYHTISLVLSMRLITHYFHQWK